MYDKDIYLFRNEGWYCVDTSAISNSGIYLITLQKINYVNLNIYSEIKVKKIILCGVNRLSSQTWVLFFQYCI